MDSLIFSRPPFFTVPTTDMRFILQRHRFWIMALLMGLGAFVTFGQAMAQTDPALSGAADPAIITTEEPAASMPEDNADLPPEALIPTLPDTPAGDSTAPPLVPDAAAMPPVEVPSSAETAASLPAAPAAESAAAAATPVSASGAAPLTAAPAATQPAPAEKTEVHETVVPVIPALPPGETSEDNLFFDADALVPEGEMAIKAGPRKVNPVNQPGSKLVIVTKDAKADSPRATLVSAQRALQLGLYDSALEIYETLYQKNPKDPNVLLGRAIAMQRLGRDEAAVAAYGELLDQVPDNMDARINMYGIVGKRYPAVALQQLLGLWDKNPTQIGVIAQVAVIQANLGRYGDALKSLGVAASLDPNNPAHIFNMAVISDKGGNKKDAIALYERALEIDTMTGARTIPRDAVFQRLAELR